MSCILILSTIPDLKSARSIAGALVNKKLAACVSIQAMALSLYRWKGKLEKAKEALLIIKTTKGKFLKVERVIKAMHTYSAPEIVAVPITQGSPEYLKWIKDSVE